MNVTIPAEYGYVLITALASTFVNQWHGLKVGQARTKAGVPYPNTYATHEESTLGNDKYAFNCAQRTHMNFIENLPQFYVSLLISGLMFPKFAAVAGANWLFGRVLYHIGYVNRTKPNGKGRFLGAPFIYSSQLGLWGTAGYVCYKMVTGA
ncbi:hypothetical protein H072_6408 [Dactylellina haptotyla CBS 200.50]|uniref:Uncharacterized protein n=1 Tax=Dactylellina haptotyla (strain CBS 200.50) TaxID=1284197 RepID=S8AFA6_DACHA|nr:hypothetical protein H072_6408 [Dactylellina haptotyla CBS 200.50]